MMAALRFYPDENVPITIAGQLKSRGIDAITARDLGHLGGDTDAAHLQRAAEMGRVLCTFDPDFVQLTVEGFSHAGIILGQPEKHWIGDWVKGLTLYHAIYDGDEMLNRVEHL